MAVALVGAIFATWYRLLHYPRTDAARPVPGESDRVVVEVINTTTSLGLARAATRVLRDAGLDVVYYAGDPGQPLDSTQILVRRGDGSPAGRVKKALGTGQVRPLPDSTRLVDITVRLGRDFAALKNP